MNTKIKALITLSILGLVALSYIQGYLINNTYKLKKDTFIENTKRSISGFNEDDVFDPFNDLLFEHLIKKISDYKLNNISKSDLFNDYQNFKDSINSNYISAYKAVFRDRNIGYDLKFHRRLKSIVIFNDNSNDTIYSESEPLNMIHIIGEDFNPKKGYVTNRSKTQTDYNSDYIDTNGVWQSLNINFEVAREDYIVANDWNSIVLSQMTGLLVLSILIFILVISLLYYSIKNLITQKKIADIKTDFVNNITHEFKTPLATLTLATKMLEKDQVKAKPDVIDTTIKTINRQSSRLQKLLDQVLDNSLGAEQLILNKTSLNANAYVTNVLNDFMLSTKDHTVELTKDLDTNITISVDTFYFTTALINILENAIKYATDTPKIHCNLSASATHFTVAITDNGIGISEHHKKQILDKFFRIDQTQIHNVKGLGLGLYYTNEIVKAHDGNISIQSQLGKGSTFNISIPLKS
ncbi:sensor histidine kinase [Winogradskyella immobilis]|uniref:histidine kinase n=1 Tax=Winogradskyella immobilis TaxID=2816852 RepID=A0ABS8EPP4_9FLAO|nr:HAMP domain-containing sensor histidine kinase [Winogradskyella immobilis]MCC1485185.1 HAMP domain-containing histidine kinase [Winogradskyella immobilis]MCG0017277.1 HAMP domain-containing histidine kinase [Winogradskyella immobilis]